MAMTIIMMILKGRLQSCSTSRKSNSAAQEDEDYANYGEYSYPSIMQSLDGAIHCLSLLGCHHRPAPLRGLQHPDISFIGICVVVRYARISEQWIKDGFTIGMHKGD
eukprot:scaffold199629_cov30-Prasinocladus_malaysianus.AAC.1